MSEKSAKLLVAISLDVEEEGLFGGKYQCHNPPVSNLAALPELLKLVERGVRPTLFCAWPVLEAEPCRAILMQMAQTCEIGAHLHYWNTPPIPPDSPSQLNSVPARCLTMEIFEQKLRNVCNAARQVSGREVKSFRMGRWDLHRAMLPVLAKCGIACDASVRPLHWQLDGGNGPDHFHAPADPYWIRTPAGNLLEVPLTALPLFKFLAKIPPQYLPSFVNWGALTLLAVYHPLWLMKMVTNVHVSRGGKVLSLTWHSSEMSAGCTPHLPDEPSVQAFMKKIGQYLDWLEDTFDIAYVQMRDLAKFDGFTAPACGRGDWIWENGENDN